MGPAPLWPHWQERELAFRNQTPNQGIYAKSIRKAGLVLAPFDKKLNSDGRKTLWTSSCH